VSREEGREHPRRTEEDGCGKSQREEGRRQTGERGRAESGEVGLVGKLKLFPDSEWKHFVVAAAAVAAVVSSFPVTAVHRCPLRNTIALCGRARKFEARPSLRERTDSLSLSVNASRFPASPAVSRISARVSIAGVYPPCNAGQRASPNFIRRSCLSADLSRVTLNPMLESFSGVSPLLTEMRSTDRTSLGAELSIKR